MFEMYIAGVIAFWVVFIVHKIKHPPIWYVFIWPIYTVIGVVAFVQSFMDNDNKTNPSK